MRTNTCITVALVIVLFFMCTLNVRPDNGGASETVNATIIIHDTLVSIQTTAKEDFKTEIYVVKDSYSPSDSTGIHTSLVISNSDALKFSIPDGKYNIFLLNRDSLLSCSFFQIPVFTGEKDTLTDTFSISGSISGSVTIAQPVPVLVYLQGSPFFKKLTDDSTYAFQHVPSGLYTIAAEVAITEPVWDAEFKKGVADDKGKAQNNSRKLSRVISLESGSSINEINLYFSN